MIKADRKIQIGKLAEYIANEFSERNFTLLNEITKFEQVPVYYDNYENAFDGMLLYDLDNKDFHIHINTDNGNTQNSKRGRFTLAHELGHYFLDTHRLGLKYGLLEPHASFHNINQKSLIEIEADYFASCLLMPKNKFKSFSSEQNKLTGNKKFSIDTIIAVSDSFQTSLLSTLIRFGEVGTHEIFAVVSKDNIAKWFVRSHDFPNWTFKFKIGSTLPQTSIAGDYLTKEYKKISGIEIVSADDWFFTPLNDKRAFRKMYEQCYYYDSNGYAISLIWFD